MDAGREARGLRQRLRDAGGRAGHRLIEWLLARGAWVGDHPGNTEQVGPPHFLRESGD